MDEFAAIERLFAPLAKGEPGAFALTDDAAVLALPPGRRLVVTKDVMVAGVHFLVDDEPALVGRKLLRVNLSDLAAMGANPRAYLLGATLSLPFDEAWLAGFTEGLRQDQESFGVTLVGGDTTAHRGPIVLSLTALGEIEAGRELRRAGARPGDLVIVSGTIGDGVLGLKVLNGGFPDLAASHRKALAGRYHLPEPRVALGRNLVGVAHAAIDVSDGLVADLGHVCHVSGVGAVIEAAQVPLSPAARAVVAEEADLPPGLLTGGDDYELLFAIDPDTAGRLPELAAASAVALTVIGRIVEGRGIQVVDATGKPLALPDRTGWTHF